MSIFMVQIFGCWFIIEGDRVVNLHILIFFEPTSVIVLRKLVHFGTIYLSMSSMTNMRCGARDYSCYAPAPFRSLKI